MHAHQDPRSLLTRGSAIEGPLMPQSVISRALLDSLNIRRLACFTTALRYVFVLLN